MLLMCESKAKQKKDTKTCENVMGVEWYPLRPPFLILPRIFFLLLRPIFILKADS